MNVPLKDGIDDQSYAALFKPVMSKLIEVYQPTAVVFQSGMYVTITAAPLATARCTAELQLPFLSPSCRALLLLGSCLAAALFFGSCLVAALHFHLLGNCNTVLTTYYGYSTWC